MAVPCGRALSGCGCGEVGCVAGLACVTGGTCRLIDVGGRVAGVIYLSGIVLSHCAFLIICICMLML